jgi:outer membrane lipoprotein-sorting protein
VTQPAVVVAALAVLGYPALAGAQDPVPILERSAAVYADLVSLQATFDQVVDNEMIGRMESHGQLYQAGQTKLALRFEDPPDEAIISDGEYIWVYTPSATPNQVVRFALPDTPTYGFNVLSWILDKPAERYHSTYRERTTLMEHPVDVIDLVPRDESLPFTSAVVWLDTANALPRRVTLVEPHGSTRSFTLWGFRLDEELPRNTFDFVVPRGIEIVDQ